MAQKRPKQRSKKLKHPAVAPSRVRSFLPGALLLIAITAIAYLPAFRAGFIWDDPDYVINNHTLRDLTGLGEIWFHPTSLPQWYPLVHTTFWIEYQFFGAQSATIYHVTNIVLHTINALLLWRLLARLNVPGAWLAAAIFAGHPVHVESVAWVTERKNVLSLLFYLCALQVFLLRVTDIEKPTAPRWVLNPKSYALALILFTCALFSKTVTASFPAAILVILWWKRGRITRRDVIPLAPFFLLGLLMSTVTSYLEHTHVGADGTKIVELNLSLIQRILIAGRAIWFYATKLIAPFNLTFIYPRWDSIDRIEPWLWIFPVAVIAVIVALFALRNRFGRGPLAASLLFCGTLVPALGFVNVYPMRFSYVADHFQYHASIALIALLAAIIWRVVGRVQPYVVSAVLLLPLLLLTYRQATIYDNAETLWRDTLSKNERSWMVQTNLAKVLIAQDRIEEAAPLFLRALELDPKIHDTHVNAGSVYGWRGDNGRAIAEFQEALRINPDFAPAYYNWGQVLERQGDENGAVEKYRKSLAIAEHYPEANFRLARILERRGLLDEAIAHYRDAIAYNPTYVAARYNLGSLLLNRKEFDEAMYNFIQALKADPTNVEAWTNLGAAQLQTGHVSDAAYSFQQALQLRPGFPPAAAGLRRAQGL
ncbi:MAG: tetratricopeptide repeat protein [Anaerolineae bacterium]|nr:tetratricopeptide repeat protein [Phycisphaerae bacterium]